MLRYCCVFLFILCSMSVFGQFSIDAQTSFDKTSLFEYAKYYETSENLTLTEVRNVSDNEFQAFESQNPNIGFTENHFWIRFELQNNTQDYKSYFLETARPITDIADLFVLESDKVISIFKNGDIIPFKEKAVQHRKQMFKIELPAASKRVYFLHLKSDGEVINLPLILRTTENLINVTAYEQIVFGFFYGILSLAAIVYLFFFFGINNRSFLYYGLYVIFIGLMQFSLDGYFYQYISPSAGYFTNRSVLIFASISAIFLGKYTETFLNIRKYNPLIVKGYWVVYVSSGLVLFALVLIPSALPYCYPAANAIGFLVLFLIISSLVSVYRNTQKIDVFFFTGIFFLVLGFVIFILNNFSVITNSFVTENAPKFGTGFEIIFLSLSMSNLIKNLKDDREQLQFIALQKSEEMNELKLYFLSNISHELRTPLNIIMNLMDKIAGKVKKKVQLDCEIVKNSTQSLLSSVNDILDFSKIEKDEFVLSNESFDPFLLIEDVSKNYAYLAENHDLTFEFVSENTVPFNVMGDRDRLRQVLNNLLNNAVKFTPKGKIIFETKWVEKPDGIVDFQILISDTGIGISKQKIEGIFNSFSQESINNKRKYGGLGLGLYIVKKIVDESNGSIVIESKPDEGTVCKVNIPYQKVQLKLAETTVESTADYDLMHKNILVVEDNLLNQLVLKKILKSWQNTEVEFANNGLECLEKLKSKTFDIILMDLQMPEMDGYEATICIRSGEVGENYKMIPIIAVTADIMESTKKRVFELGINGYLTKPIEKNLLFDQILKLVS